MNELIAYVTTYWEPLTGMAAGILIFIFIGYMNWYGTVKTDIVRWIAKHIFRNGFRSETSADGLFMTATSFLLFFGGILIIVASLYLF